VSSVAWLLRVSSADTLCAVRQAGRTQHSPSKVCASAHPVAPCGSPRAQHRRGQSQSPPQRKKGRHRRVRTRRTRNRGQARRIVAAPPCRTRVVRRPSGATDAGHSISLHPLRPREGRRRGEDSTRSAGHANGGCFSAILSRASAPSALHALCVLGWPAEATVTVEAWLQARSPVQWEANQDSHRH